jgi:UTP--glucose-1-phosphate uridylyltransferase
MNLKLNINNSTSVRKCLFPAAGYGTRFLPATKAVPKEMLPILTKPLLQYGVEEALAAGIDIMAIVTGRGKRSIEDHFDNAFELESQLSGTPKESYLTEIKNVIESATFTYVRQRQMLGLGNAILTGEHLIGNEPFAVVLADDLCNCDERGVLSQMKEIYNKYQCSIIAIEEISMDQTNKYGVIAGNLVDGTNDTYQVTDMIEKPESKDAPTNMAIIGRYILTPDIFKILRNTKPGSGGEVQITDALLTQAKQGKVIAYKFKGKRFDCGSVEGYVEATNHYAKKHGIK